VWEVATAGGVSRPAKEVSDVITESSLGGPRNGLPEGISRKRRGVMNVKKKWEKIV